MVKTGPACGVPEVAVQDWLSTTRGVSASPTWITGGADRLVSPSLRRLRLRDIELATDCVISLQ